MRRAFTMLEIIVALALILLLMGAVLGFIAQLRTDRAIMDASVTSSAQAGGFIERLEGDLLGIIAGDPVLGPGLKGDASTLTVLSRAVSTSEAETGAIASGLARTVYRFAESSGMISAARTDALGVGTATGESQEVATGVSRVRVRFFVDSSTGFPLWVDSFDSLQRGVLPRAVEVAIWFGKPKSAEDADAGGADASGADASAANSSGGGLLDSASPAGELTLSDKPVVAPDRVRVIAILGGGGVGKSAGTDTFGSPSRAEVEP